MFSVLFVLKNSVKRDDLWPLAEDMSQSQLAQDGGDSEINLKEETGFVEPDRLEKMTDDAKVIMHFKKRFKFLSI